MPLSWPLIGLHDGNAAALADVSEEFERIGDIVTAVDAAAHAALVYRGRGLLGSALCYATRANALVKQCGDACTPALRHASEPLPLTDREREIVSACLRPDEVSYLPRHPW